MFIIVYFVLPALQILQIIAPFRFRCTLTITPFHCPFALLGELIQSHTWVVLEGCEAENSRLL